MVVIAKGPWWQGEGVRLRLLGLPNGSLHLGSTLCYVLVVLIWRRLSVKAPADAFTHSLEEACSLALNEAICYILIWAIERQNESNLCLT